MNNCFFIENYVHHETESIALVNLFNHWNTHTPYSQLNTLLTEAWMESPIYTLIMLFYTRACRGYGKGDRIQFYRGVWWFMEYHPEQILKNLRLIPEYGYWKDLLNIWIIKNELLRASIVYIYCKQLLLDLHGLERGDKISLAAKWAPTEKGHLDKKWGMVNIFCEQLGWSKKEYRKHISSLRDALLVSERLFSDQRWGELDIYEIPTKSRLLHHKTLQYRCGNRYCSWVPTNPKRTLLNSFPASLKKSAFTKIKIY